MKRQIITIIIVLAILMQVVIPVAVFAQDPVTVTSSADATLVEGDGTLRGTEGSINIAGGENKKSFVVRFDVGVIPKDATIENATLSLNQISSSGEASVTVNAYKVTSAWSEGSVSGTNPPSYSTGTVYGSMSLNSSSGLKTFPQNVAGIVGEWVKKGNLNYGLYLTSSSAGTFERSFSSKEGGSGPTLQVTYSVESNTPPIISSVKSISINETSYEVKWNTNKESTSYVEYGTTTNYGKEAGNDDMFKNHSVVLVSLKPGTLYHYRVRSEDRDGNVARSGDYTFQTEAAKEREQKPDKKENSQPVKTDYNVSNEIPVPDNVKAEAKRDGDTHYVEIVWDEVDEDDVKGYKIYRSAFDNTSYSLLSETDKDETSYRDEDVEVGETYYYVVRTVKKDGESSDSEEQVVTIYASELEKQLHNVSFWKGFLICNLCILPIFGLGYLIYRRKKGKLDKGSKRGGARKREIKKQR